MKTLKELFNCAADRLEKNGWTQGEYVREDGRCCALGAIALCADETLFGMPGWREKDPGYNPKQTWDAAEFLTSHFLHKSVHVWNDLPNQNAENVILLLRQAAAEVAN